MAYLSIYIHMVWATKRRSPLLEKPQRFAIIKAIREMAKEKGIHIVEINGHVDHLHALISLSSDQTISSVAQTLKGGSSYWANNIDDTYFKEKLKWAKSYYAASVSKTAVTQVCSYIENQEAHHSKKTFEEECQEFKKHYGFEELYE